MSSLEGRSQVVRLPKKTSIFLTILPPVLTKLQRAIKAASLCFLLSSKRNTKTAIPIMLISQFIPLPLNGPGSNFPCWCSNSQFGYHFVSFHYSWMSQRIGFLACVHPHVATVIHVQKLVAASRSVCCFRFLSRKWKSHWSDRTTVLSWNLRSAEVSTRATQTGLSNRVSDVPQHQWE